MPTAVSTPVYAVRKTATRRPAPRVGERSEANGSAESANPTAADLPNQAINHAASAVEAAAAVAVAATGTIPQLGFIHEDSGQSFVLDIADLFRDSVTLPAAFRAAKEGAKRADQPIERLTRRWVGETMRGQATLPAMIERIKTLFEAGD